MSKINLNDVPFEFWDYEENSFEQDGKSLKELSFKIETQGIKEYQLAKNLFGMKEITVGFSDNDSEIKTKVSSWSYQSPPDGVEDITVTFNVTLKEVDPDASDWELNTGLSFFAIQSMLKVDTLRELLIDKGIFTLEEVKEKFDSVKDRDYQKRMNLLFTGDENNEKYKQTEEE
jgi:hypothetical protein